MNNPTPRPRDARARSRWTAGFGVAAAALMTTTVALIAPPAAGDVLADIAAGRPFTTTPAGAAQSSNGVSAGAIDVRTTDEITITPKPGFCRLDLREVDVARSITPGPGGSWTLRDWDYRYVNYSANEITAHRCDGSGSDTGSLFVVGPVQIWVEAATPWEPYSTSNVIVPESIEDDRDGVDMVEQETRIVTTIDIDANGRDYQWYLTRNGQRANAPVLEYYSGVYGEEIQIQHTRADTAHTWAVNVDIDGRTYTQPIDLPYRYAPRSGNRQWERCETYRYYYDPTGQPRAARGITRDIDTILATLTEATNATFTPTSNREDANLVIEWVKADTWTLPDVYVVANTYNGGAAGPVSSITLFEGEDPWWKKPGFGVTTTSVKRGTIIARTLTYAAGMHWVDGVDSLMEQDLYASAGFFTDNDLRGLQALYPARDCQYLN